jgi:signal peptidase II
LKPASPQQQPVRIDPLIIGIGVVVLALDQWTKTLATANLGPGAASHSVDVIGSFLRFSYTTNTGAAFGMLQGATALFALIAVAAVPIFLLAPRFLGLSGTLVRAISGMLLGGALGNLVDRVLREGRVTDFIDMGIGDLRFWTYNIADSSFVIGVTVLVVYMLFFVPADSAGPNEPSPECEPAKSRER